MDQVCYEARLIRFIIEKNLTNVQFESHQDQDKAFLEDKLNFLDNQVLLNITAKALRND